MANEENNQPEVDAVETVANEEQVEAQAEASTEEVSVEAQLEQALAELSEAKDQSLRTQAEMQNVRRRAEQDVEKARKFALEKFSKDLLPVVDNLERAVEAADLENEAVKALCEGIELTQKSFIDVLARFKLEQLDPVGEPFDPQLHEAMAMVPAPDAEPNTVINVVQKGYTLNGRLVRAAMVVVSQAAPKVDAQA